MLKKTGCKASLFVAIAGSVRVIVVITRIIRASRVTIIVVAIIIIIIIIIIIAVIVIACCCSWYWYSYDNNDKCNDPPHNGHNI